MECRLPHIIGSLAYLFLPNLSDDLLEQPLGLLLHCQNIRADLVQAAKGLRLVEIAREADFVADLHALRHVPGVGCIGQDLALEKRVDSSLFQKGDLLGVSQIRVGLVLHDGGSRLDSSREEASQRVGVRPLLVDPFDDRRSLFSSRGALAQRPYLLGRVDSIRVDAGEAQRTLDGHLPVADGGVREDLRLIGLFESQEGIANPLNVLIRELAVLLAQIFAQRFEPLRRVNELHTLLP